MQSINKKQKNIVVLLFLLILSIILFILIRNSSSATLVSAYDLEKRINSDKVKEVYIKDKYLYLQTSKALYKSYVNGVDLKKIYIKYPVKVYTKSSNYLMYIALFLLLSILVAIIAILKRDNSFDISMNAKLQRNKDEEDELKNIITPSTISDVDFNSIAGIEDIKEDLEEIIEFLKNPAKFKMLDIKMPKGLLLVGPPGVGKTLIAKAVSNEANVPFFYHSGANFVQIYAGMGAKKVKELFAKAKELAPSIIFIDEIDAVGKSRDRLNSDEREATLNQLLVEMDGFEDNLGVVVIAATNRVDVLDSALLRAGRFDRRLFIELPNIKEREQIIKHYLKHKKYSFNPKELAKITAGFSPATIEVLINEAWLKVYKSKKNIIDMQDIYDIKDRVVYGKKRVLSLNKQEKEIVALYQVSKAVVAIWYSLKFDKLSLLSNLSISEDIAIISKEYLINKLKLLIAGSVYLNSRSKNFYSIAKEDIKDAKDITLDIEQNYTLNKKSIDINEVIKDVDSLLNRFEVTIVSLSKELIEKETLTYSEIKKKLDEVF